MSLSDYRFHVSPLGSFLISPLGARGIPGGDLYVAGSFQRWNGAGWDTVGGGAACRRLINYQGDLVVGGDFSTVNGGTVSARRVAAWDGASWSTFGSEWQGNGVWAMTVWDGKLVVGGSFGTHTAYWDGSSWTVINTGLSTNTCVNLCVHGTDLYGTFQNDRIRRWTGTTWQALGTIQPDTASHGLVSHAGTLYASVAAGTGDYRVYSWDGSSWTQVGSSFAGYVPHLASIDGTLYMAGFSQNTPTQIAIVAYWSGSSWVTLGTISGAWANQRLGIYKGKLILVGGQGGNRILEWDGSAWGWPVPPGGGGGYQPTSAADMIVWP